MVVHKLKAILRTKGNVSFVTLCNRRFESPDRITQIPEKSTCKLCNKRYKRNKDASNKD